MENQTIIDTVYRIQIRSVPDRTAIEMKGWTSLQTSTEGGSVSLQ